MDKINHIRIKLQKMEEKYPLFVECWKKFLNMRETSFLKSIENCDKAIELIKKNNIDLTPETIGLLLTLLNNNNNLEI
jgi:hypothetical protein